jgi:hypothetical protein
VSPFAKVFEAVLSRQCAVAAATPFEDAVAAFDARVASSLTEPAGGLTREAWAVELGVAWPCTAAELRRAFRRRAFETHPDRAGGSNEAFIRVQSLLKQGAAAVAAQANLPAPSAARRYGAPRAPRAASAGVYA